MVQKRRTNQDRGLTMKTASKFEIIAARGWNILNEGKTFTPVFIIGTMLLFHWTELTQGGFWLSFGLQLLWLIPMFAVYYIFDFPLHLRNFLWLPLALAGIWFTLAPIQLYLLALGLYFFFTVIFWGTIYYHLRIGTTLKNFTRFWKLVLKNSDSTSGNAQEQLPKILLLLTLFENGLTPGGTGNAEITTLVFTAALALYSFIIHYFLFRWKPEELQQYTSEKMANPTEAKVQRVIMCIVDGCRKDRLAEAKTPFIDWLQDNGTEFTAMETVYPARTVVCFSSMYTGTYPREHGIKSNMVWRLGVRCESIFDSLRKIGKKGKLLGIAHLIDSFGEDVESVTAVMKNDVADANIMARARKIMKEQNPDCLIVQLIATDQTGHSRGALYDEYKEKIEEADAHLASFYQWLTDEGYMEDTVWIVAADHGQSDGIGGHGHLDEGERFVPFIMNGPGIKKGVKVDGLHTLVSVAPTISYLLGAPYPNRSRGPVLVEAMERSNDNGHSSDLIDSGNDGNSYGNINDEDNRYHNVGKSNKIEDKNSLGA